MEQPILSFLTAYFSDLHIQCRLTDRKQLELADLDLGLRNSILMQEADAQKQAPFHLYRTPSILLSITTSAIIPFSVCRIKVPSCSSGPFSGENLSAPRFCRL